MHSTWIVVADGRHARIFTTEDPYVLDLIPVRELTNHHHAPEHRRHPAVGHDHSHHHEEQKFAREIAEHIEHATATHEVERVVLVAPTKFTSDVEAALPTSAAHHIAARIHKDLTKVERTELARHIRAELGIVVRTIA